MKKKKKKKQTRKKIINKKNHDKNKNRKEEKMKWKREQKGKKWGDVREVFIPNRRNYSGRRYGFVRFKGVRDVPYLARQLDRIIIGGLKLYVNIPKHGREKPAQGGAGIKLQRNEGGTQTQADHARQPHQTHPASYREVVMRNNRAPRQ